jgi:FdhD protein
LDGERSGNVTHVSITEISRNSLTQRLDTLATEEPLEIRVLKYNNSSREWTKNTIAVTMRTPGNDFELAAGFLISEGVIRRKRDIETISYCTDLGEKQQYNIVNVYLAADIRFDHDSLSRHVYTSSSCGICGKGSIELVRIACPNSPIGAFQISFDELAHLPAKLNESQNIFGLTGGLHASGLFDKKGNLLLSREDVGRHNALDKVLGFLLMKDRLPATDSILLVSGRASFELVQKAALAGIPFMAAIGAPSSLAVSLANEYGMTLVGFLKESRCNVYSGKERIQIR